MAVRIDIGGRNALAAELKKNHDLIKKTKGEMKETVKLGKEGARDWKKLIESQITPQERYNRTLQNAKTLLDGSREGQRKYAEVVEAANRRLVKQSKAHQSAFGSRALSDIKGMAAGVVSLSTATRIAAGAFQDLATQRNRAAEAGTGAELALSKGKQLAVLQDDPQAFLKRFESQSLFLRSQGAVSSIAEGAGAAFQAHSAGLEKDIPTLAKIGRSGAITDLAAVIQGSEQVSSNLPGSGNTKQIISRAIAASGVSSTSVEKLLSAAAQAGATGGLQGANINELLAASAVLSKGTDIGQASTQLQSFFASGIRQNIDEKGLLGAIADVQGRGLNKQELFKFLGRKESLNAFLKLTQPENAAKLQKTLSATQDAASGTLVDALSGIEGSDQLTTATRRRISRGEREVRLFRQSGDVNQARTRVDTLRSEAEDAGAGALERGFGGFFGETATSVFGESLISTGAFAAGRAIGRTTSQSTGAQVVELLNAIATQGNRKPEAVPTVEK